MIFVFDLKFTCNVHKPKRIFWFEQQWVQKKQNKTYRMDHLYFRVYHRLCVQLNSQTWSPSAFCEALQKLNILDLIWAYWISRKDIHNWAVTCMTDFGDEMLPMQKSTRLKSTFVVYWTNWVRLHLRPFQAIETFGNGFHVSWSLIAVQISGAQRWEYTWKLRAYVKEWTV